MKTERKIEGRMEERKWSEKKKEVKKLGI
jgi:hypothetical protein